MPVTITVSQVRGALYHAAGAASASGDGAPSTAVLGRWFHEGIGLLVGDGSHASPMTQLAELDADLEIWKQALVADAYAQFVGPRLTSQQAALKHEAAQVLAFWQAMREACHWLAELNWRMRPERSSRRARPSALWQTLSQVLTTEEPLACVLREPDWSDSVRLVGIADAVVRLADTGFWCAVEFKLGQTSPEADLGQACLYHLMLSAADATRDRSHFDRTGTGRTAKDQYDLENPPRADAGTLALISFRPQRCEQLFTVSELVPARNKLIDLIGKLAGVAAPSASPEVRITRSIPAPASSPRAGPEALEASAGTQAAQDQLDLGRRLVEIFAEYGVRVSLDQPAIVGPTFIRFPITLGRGTLVSAVQRYAAEIQVRLQLKAEPFIGLEDGCLSIDVQRPDREEVSFDEIRRHLDRPGKRWGGSRVPIGVDLFRRLVCADLARPEHAHLLVAGTTGSGKSEWLRLAVAGLIAANTPETLRLMVIDPKRNAFHALRDSPFLWKPLVFPDDQPVAEALNDLADEMDCRYRMFDGADSFQQVVEKSERPLPRIVCVCDEYRDLINRNRQERKLIEAQICRLGAKARAAGIHLILATQEASRDTIKGPLDANIPARVGLKMGKDMESRMLLSQSGAENLLGHGDLLFRDIGLPRRLQAPLLSEANRAEIFGRR